ncbi:MAG: oligosaccharide flippase family protein [Pseudomonadota bacterium]
MNPVTTFIKNIFYSAFNSILLRIIAFVCSVIIIRVLSKTDYGLWALIFAIVGLFNSVSNIGMPLMTIKSISQYHESDNPKAASYYRFNLKLYGLITMFFALVLFLSAPSIATIYDIPYAVDLIRLSAILYILYSLISFYEWTFTGLNQFKAFALKVCLPREVIILISLLFFLWSGLRVSGIIFAQILGVSVALIMALGITLRKLSGKSEIDKGWIIRGALETAPGNIAFAATEYLDVIIISGILTTSLLASYRACLAIVLIFYGFFPIGPFVIPTLNSMTRERGRVFLNDILRLSLIVLLPVVFFLASFAREFIAVLLGQKYADSGALLAMFAFVVPGRILNHIVSYTLVYLERFKRSSMITGSMALFYLFILICLVKLIGLPGAVLSAILLQYISFLWVSYDISRHGMPVQMVPLLKIIFSGGILSLNLFCISQFGIILRIFIFMATAAAYLVLLKSAGIFKGIESLKDMQLPKKLRFGNYTTLGN